MYCSSAARFGSGLTSSSVRKSCCFGVLVAARPVAADADADRARRAAVPLRLPDRVENALTDAVESSVRPSQMRQLARDRVLDVFVLAARLPSAAA